MIMNSVFQLDDVNIMDGGGPYEDFKDHAELKERLKKTLYFGKTPRMDRPSLPMTELAVEYFHETVPRQLGQVDMYWASSVSKRASISPCAMMLGMIYIDRLRHKNPDYIEKMSSEELFLISMMLASKYLYDEGVSEEVYNDEWADSANLDVEDVNQLEFDFLQAIDWNVYVNEEDFLKTLTKVEQHVAFKQSKHNGFLTYSDFCVLLQNENLMKLKWNLLKDICKMFAICSVAYTAGALTMAGSVVTLDLIRAELQAVEPLIFDQLPLPVLVKHLGIFQQPWFGIHNQHLQDMPVPNPEMSHVNDEGTSGCDGNVTPQKSVQESNEDFVSRGKQTIMYSASRFLTLTLFKDTLMAFVFGMKNECAGKDDGSEASHPSVPLQVNVCRCHMCPLKMRRPSRRNKTCHDGLSQDCNRPADTNWSHRFNRLLGMNRHLDGHNINADCKMGGNLCRDKSNTCVNDADEMSESECKRSKLIMEEDCTYNDLLSSRYIPASLHTVPVLA